MPKTIDAQPSLIAEDIPAQPQALVRNHFDLLALAIQDKANIDVIERLSALQERAMDRDAEQQFNEAMCAAQGEIGLIAPDLTNPQTNSKYASFKAVDKIVRPVYLKHGFSLSFNNGDEPRPEMVRMICYVSHRAGHTRKYQMDMPADGKGAKGGAVMTATHATGAANSYGKRYIVLNIFNIPVGVDTDGNEGQVEQSWLKTQLEEIGRCETEEGLLAAFRSAGREALAIQDIEAYRQLNKAKNSRKKELQKGGA
jgi:hypothetical protein